MGSSQNWLAFVRQMRRVFPSWTFAAIDLPGHGETNAEICEPNLPSIAQSIFNSLAAFGWVPTILVGHSFGGKTVLQLSNHYSNPLSIWLLDAPIGEQVSVTGIETIYGITKLVARHPHPKDRKEMQSLFEREGFRTILLG